MLRMQTAPGTCVTVCAVGTCGRSDSNWFRRRIIEFENRVLHPNLWVKSVV